MVMSEDHAHRAQRRGRGLEAVGSCRKWVWSVGLDSGNWLEEIYEEITTLDTLPSHSQEPCPYQIWRFLERNWIRASPNLWFQQEKRADVWLSVHMIIEALHQTPSQKGTFRHMSLDRRFTGKKFTCLQEKSSKYWLFMVPQWNGLRMKPTSQTCPHTQLSITLILTVTQDRIPLKSPDIYRKYPTWKRETKANKH